jgi:Domain of unknown function (DUF3291)
MTIVQPTGHHLAQLNVARALGDMTSPRLADFTSALDLVNNVAERSSGFVWRLKDDGANNATDIRVTDDTRFIVNTSVWESAADLEHFVWNTIHQRVYEKNEVVRSDDNASFRNVVGAARPPADNGGRFGTPQPFDERRSVGARLRLREPAEHQNVEEPALRMRSGT